MPGGVVQVAGRLVRQQERGAVDQGPGERHPLLLAGGQLVRAVALLAGEVDGREHLADRRRLLAAAGVAAGDDEGQGDVLADRQDRQRG